MKQVGVCLQLTADHLYGEKGQYYNGIDSGQYGSGYPIWRDTPMVMEMSAAVKHKENNPNDPLEIHPVYVDDGT